jgi:hypothetical protein
MLANISKDKRCCFEEANRAVPESAAMEQRRFDGDSRNSIGFEAIRGSWHDFGRERMLPKHLSEDAFERLICLRGPETSLETQSSLTPMRFSGGRVAPGRKNLRLESAAQSVPGGRPQARVPSMVKMALS